MLIESVDKSNTELSFMGCVACSRIKCVVDADDDYNDNKNNSDIDAAPEVIQRQEMCYMFLSREKMIKLLPRHNKQNIEKSLKKILGVILWLIALYFWE